MNLLTFYSIVAVLVGACRIWVIPLGGMMPVSELLLALVLAHAGLCAVLNRTLPARPAAPRFLLLFLACQVVAFASYVASDIIDQSAPGDMIRGWLRMGFVMIDITALALLFGASEKTFTMLQIGTCLSCLQALVMTPLFGDYWKFGFGYPLTIVALLAAPRFFGFWGATAACVFMGAVHTVMDFRSMGAICLGLGALNGMHLLPRPTRRLLLLCVAAVGLATLPWTTKAMFADTQGRANRSNVERAAMIRAAWEGFLRSPWIGNGSWFSNSKVMDEFLLIRAQMAREGGGGMGFDDTDFEGVAIHSQLLVSVAEGGIVGGTFFAVYALFIVWGFWFALTEAAWTWLMPVKLLLLITSFWDVFMSAFTGPIRVQIATTVALLLLFLDERRRLRAAAPAEVNDWEAAARERRLV